MTNLKLKGKNILIVGGTGSLGKVLIRRLLRMEKNTPEKIIVFSRDEAKQHQMMAEYQQKSKNESELIYQNYRQKVEFLIGDIRNRHSLSLALKKADIVINTAALKQVPICEYFPIEAVQTNIIGPENIVRVIHEEKLKIDTVVGISTDKACKPVSAMGMTKAIQERILIVANIHIPSTRFICVRYGNVLASRGSVIPLFYDQIRNGGPVTITSPEMTRFLLPLEQAVDTIFAAIDGANRGEIYIPKIPAAKIVDIAKILIGNRKIEIQITGIRPGEKIHEMMISEEEARRTFDCGNYYAIQPMLSEMIPLVNPSKPLNHPYSSQDIILSAQDLKVLLKKYHLLDIDNNETEEFLR